MNIEVFKVPQFSGKKLNVICVDGIPICTVRGKKNTSNIIAKLSGYDIEVNDGRIDKIITNLRNETSKEYFYKVQEPAKFIPDADIVGTREEVIKEQTKRYIESLTGRKESK